MVHLKSERRPFNEFEFRLVVIRPRSKLAVTLRQLYRELEHLEGFPTHLESI
jgi:hypothetical protein